MKKILKNQFVLKKTDVKFYIEWFGKINLETAQAWRQDDQNKINDYLNQVGFLKVNDAVLVPLKKWFVDVSTKAALECPPKSEEVGNVYFVKGCIHEALGEGQESAEWYEKACDAYVLSEGTRKSPLVARCLNNWALVIQRFENWDLSLKLSEEAIEINRELQGEESFEHSANINNLAGIYFHNQDYQKALELYEKSLEIRKKIFGENHLEVAIVIENCAVTLETMSGDNLMKSMELKKKAIEIKRNVLGNDHAELAVSLSNMGVLLERLKDFDEASKFYEESIRIRRRAFGDFHPDLAQSLNNYGGLLVQKGEPKKAMEILKNACEIFQATSGDSFATGNAYEWLSVACARASDKNQEKEAAKEAYRIFSICLGPDHQRTVTIKKNYGF